MTGPDAFGLVSDAVLSLGSGNRRIRFPAELWSHQFDGDSRVRVDFGAFNGGITREEMLQLVDRGIEENRHVDAFVVAMLWGYGPAGYGPYRTKRVLSQSPRAVHKDGGNLTIAQVLACSANAARTEISTEPQLESAARDAYGTLNNGYASGTRTGRLVPYLGPSFFTKWLSAASAKGVSEPEYALPILDEVIVGWWQTNVDANFKAGYTDHYVTFVNQIHEWARELSNQRGTRVSPLWIEEAIFEAASGGAENRFDAVRQDGVFLP